MKTITIDGIKILEEKLLERGWIAPKPKGRWEPEKGDDYWTSACVNRPIVWEDDEVDKRLWKAGGVFKTIQESLVKQHRIEAKVRVTDKLRELEGNWILDWDDEQDKCYAYFKHRTHAINIATTGNHQQLAPELYSTEEAWEWVVENMEEDLKLIWEIEE